MKMLNLAQKILCISWLNASNAIHTVSESNHACQPSRSSQPISEFSCTKSANLMKTTNIRKLRYPQSITFKGTTSLPQDVAPLDTPFQNFNISLRMTYCQKWLKKQIFTVLMKTHINQHTTLFLIFNGFWEFAFSALCQ